MGLQAFPFSYLLHDFPLGCQDKGFLTGSVTQCLSHSDELHPAHLTLCWASPSVFKTSFIVLMWLCLYVHMQSVLVPTEDRRWPCHFYHNWAWVAWTLTLETATGLPQD